MAFKNKHIGINEKEKTEMLSAIGYSSIDELCNATLADDINYEIQPLQGMSEQDFEQHIEGLGKKNVQTTSLIGQGFYPNYCPSVIRRNVLENPSWYTQYTPYQAEISQGRLEALFNFQTIVTELTGLPIANASLLDEGNACAEAIFMAFQENQKNKKKCFIDQNLFKHNLNVIITRFKYLDIDIEIESMENFKPSSEYFAVLAQQFGSDGKANDYESVFKDAKNHNIITIIATDLLGLTLIKSPGEMNADIAVGSGQRLGVPMGFGGPSAAFISCIEPLTRRLPGRIIGLSKDKYGNKGYRMALQTREQHIRRERATSNICTAQALLAIINSFYVIYHGQKNLKEIAKNIHLKTSQVSEALKKNGYHIKHNEFFDTITVITTAAEELTKKALDQGIEWHQTKNEISLSFNECINNEDIVKILDIFSATPSSSPLIRLSISKQLMRQTEYLTQPLFRVHQSETKLLRYIKHLETKDLSLTHAMIPLGSCTMKLNGTTELLSLSNNNFSNIHPQSNPKFTSGYMEIITALENYLSDITGFDKTSLQPNSGAQGEFLGLLCIRDYFKRIGENNRTIAFIPTSAHGTNPASASLCGLTIVPIKTTPNGEICLDDLNKKTDQHKDNLAVLMITYPSTFGVFDKTIQTICNTVHNVGAQVYMDGANMNAQVGLTSPATIGADVCHLNLHKTFCIPHGGGGPGVGPVCVKEHLAPYLPSKSNNAIANAPYGSASICLISYAYIRLMGSMHLKEATQVAILNANYIAKKLSPHFEILYKNENHCVAHELIINCKPFKKSAKVTVEDIAKRLMDYGFHAPTMSWPVPDTLMIEPTESEDKHEIDRFCNALIQIKKEIDDITQGITDPLNNTLKNAPHTPHDIANDWNYPYHQSQAFFPIPIKTPKFWPSVNRIDSAHGDRNLVCSCQNITTTTNVELYETNAK